MDGFSFNFGIGLDPNFRLADSADALTPEMSMMRLINYKKRYEIAGELDAKIISADDAVDKSGNFGYAIGASVLRDCYGKINYFFAPSDFPAFDDIAKLLKAYRKDIRVISVSVGDAPKEPVSAYADTFIHVPNSEAVSAAEEIRDLEQLSVPPVSGGVLHAAAHEARKINDRHARYVVLLTQQ